MSENIIESINTVLEKIYASIDGKIYTLLDDLIVIGPSVITEKPLNKIFIDGGQNGMGIVAMCMISCYMINQLVLYLISMYNGNKAPNMYKSVIKIIICTVFMANSIYICKVVLNVNSVFTEMIASVGEDLTKEKICFENLKEKITDLNKYMNQDFVSLDGIIKGFVSFGTITLLINCASRYVTIIFVILVSPVAIMLSASDLTMGIFKSWLKMGVISLSVQWITLFILVIPLSFTEVGTTTYKVVIVGTIYLLYRINNFSKEIMGNISEKTQNDIKSMF